jgi:Tfp pilus assembly protein PilO
MDEKKPATKRPSKILGEYYGSIFFLLTLAFLGAAVLVLKPMLDSVKSTNAQVTASLRTLENDRTYLASLDSSVSAAQNIPGAVLDQVSRALPREAGIPELLVLLGDTATRDGVQLANVSFSEESASARLARTTSTVAEIGINLSVAAQNYPQIKRFLRDLESSLRILDVTGINVSTRGAESSYAILLKTYMYMPPRTTAATPLQR